jgi:hypothetical protein
MGCVPAPGDAGGHAEDDDGSGGGVERRPRHAKWHAGRPAVIQVYSFFAAGYLGAAIVLNVSMGKNLLPLFPTRSR